MSEASQNKKNKDEGGGFFKCRTRDRGASEERLIQAGLEIFSKFGFGGATTKMIAKKADVNESLIGRYFDGKEGLLVAIVKKFIEEMVNQTLKYPPQDTLEDELVGYVEDRIEHGCEKEEFAKIVISQALVDKKFKKTIRETIALQIDPHLVERIQRLADMGKLKPGTKVMDICEDIDVYMDGVFFFQRIMHEVPIPELKERTVVFVKRYSQIFAK